MDLMSGSERTAMSARRASRLRPRRALLRAQLGRAFRARSTVRSVVHEHQVYREGMQRAMDGQRAAWQLTLLHNRDLAKARGVSRSNWRPGTAGPAHKPQINVNPYAGPEGGDVTVGQRRRPGYRTMEREEIDQWVNKVDWLQRKCGASGQ